VFGLRLRTGALVAGTAEQREDVDPDVPLPRGPDLDAAEDGGRADVGRWVLDPGLGEVVLDAAEDGCEVRPPKGVARGPSIAPAEECTRGWVILEGLVGVAAGAILAEENREAEEDDQEGPQRDAHLGLHEVEGDELPGAGDDDDQHGTRDVPESAGPEGTEPRQDEQGRMKSSAGLTS
jgi:hypothetical protein